MTNLDPATIRALADWGDEHEDEYYWGYNSTSEKLRVLASRIEESGALGGRINDAELPE